MLRIFMLSIGIFTVAWKLVDWVFSAVGSSAQRMQADIETEKVFGKRNDDIEIYDPNEDVKGAD